MAKKKSIEIAKTEAQEASRKSPGILYRVMDKKGKSAICTASEWVYRERILSGWETVARFLNGQEV